MMLQRLINMFARYNLFEYMRTRRTSGKSHFIEKSHFIFIAWNLKAVESQSLFLFAGEDEKYDRSSPANFERAIDATGK